MNFVLLVLLALKILAISGEDEKETRERAASLVVLPPLVLGYEELYVDNDDNQPAKKDMDYPNENGGNKVTQETTPKDKKQHYDELEQREKINEEVTTEQPKETKTTKKEEKKDNKKVVQKLSDKSPAKKKEPIKDKKKKNNKTVNNKDTKKNKTKKSAKKKKTDKKKGKSKKKGKRKGKVESRQSRSESNSETSGESSGESSDESQILSELSYLYDTVGIKNLHELLNSQPSVYGVERIHPALPTRPGSIPTRNNNNFNLDLGLGNQGFNNNKAMILKNRITKETPLINDKTYVMGLNLKQTTSSLNKLISLLSRRTNNSSGFIGEKKGEMRSDDKGVITLKGQGEIGEGKEVLEFTGNFRVPKKVLDCPCFKEILRNEKPSF